MRNMRTSLITQEMSQTGDVSTFATGSVDVTLGIDISHHWRVYIYYAAGVSEIRYRIGRVSAVVDRRS